MTLPEMTRLTSSSIAEAGHDGALVGTLYLRFHGRKDKPSSLWFYAGVPRALFEKLVAGSAGTIFHTEIKPEFHGEKIE